MSALSYRRGNGVPENKRAWSCRGRNEFYLTLAPMFFHFTLYFVFCSLLVVGVSRTFTCRSALLTIASQCLSHSSLEPGYLGVKGHSPPVNNVDKETHSNPPALPLPSPLPSLSYRASSARYSCNVCLLQRTTQLQSTEQPRHAVFTYSWLWPRIDFLFFHQLKALKISI